jgi:hypothetical protein
MRAKVGLALAGLVGALAVFAAQGSGPAEARPAPSAANLFYFMTQDGPSPMLGAPSGGTSTLIRSPDGVSATISASNLVPGDVYTVWWVIFNNPALCTGGECGEDDIFAPDGSISLTPGVELSAVHAAGSVASRFGEAFFYASLAKGDNGGHQAIFGPGLLNPLGAEIHHIVRTHGPALQGAAFEQQITTFGGGCTEATGGPAGSGGFICFDAQAAMHFSPTSRSLSPLFSFANESVQGVTTLVRTDTGVSATIDDFQLEPGHAYSVWWVIFNDPEYCSGGVCGEDDIFDEDGNVVLTEAADISALNATGGVADGAGRAFFEASLPKGDTGPYQVLFGDGLVDPMGAEVHLVVRSHGPALTGDALEGQLTTFGGSCTEATGGPAGADGFVCFDDQFAVHQP